MSDDVLFRIIVESIRSEVKKVGDAPIPIESRLVEDLNFDSLDMVGIVMGIEERLHTTIEIEEIDQCVTVSDVVATLKQHLDATRC